MKSLMIVFAVILTGSGCSSQKTNSTEPINLMNATSQKWFGGVQGAGYGTDYKFFFKKQTDDAVTFDTVWIDDRPFVPEVVNISYPQQEIKPGNEFSLNMQYRKRENPYTGETDESPEVNAAKSPEFTGDALIVYKVNGQRKTMIVRTLEVKEPNFYP